MYQSFYIFNAAVLLQITDLLYFCFDFGGVWPLEHDLRKRKYTESGTSRKPESVVKSMSIKRPAPRGRSGTIEGIGEQPLSSTQPRPVPSRAWAET